MPTETWVSRDKPLLQTIVALFDSGAAQVTSQDLVTATGQSYEQLRPALRALAFEDPPFFHFKDHSSLGDRGTNVSRILDVTGHGRRAAGTWPTPEDIADRIIEAFEQAAENAPDEEEAGRLRRAGQAVAGVGRDVLVNLIAAGLGGA
jgi:hypothetical protein